MIYIHIPFCRTFCTYCGFYSELLHRTGVPSPEDFAAALAAEIRLRRDEITDTPNTLYIGGGTPSVLPLSVLCAIVDNVRAETGIHSFREFTLEMNPEDVVSGGHAYVEGLMSAGVNRVSMGIQSFDDGILKWMNRRHDAETAVKAYRILREAGADNVSIDLIFGLTQLDTQLWQKTLDTALTMPYAVPEHISAYQLSIEEGSALEKMTERGRYAEASEDQCFGQYMALCRTLASAGYRHYEVSNFALPGREAMHNSAYWNGGPYIGLGPGAHSYLIRAGVHTRSWNKSSAEVYVNSMLSGDTDSVRECETLTPEQVRIEKVMLSLRTGTGLPESVLRSACGDRNVDRQVTAGDLELLENGNVRIPEDRFFISDSIIAALL